MNLDEYIRKLLETEENVELWREPCLVFSLSGEVSDDEALAI